VAEVIVVARPLVTDDGDDSCCCGVNDGEMAEVVGLVIASWFVA